MGSIKDVAAYFLQDAGDRNERLGHLRLQKLCYYAQGFHLGVTGQSLFDEPFHAFKHGPVCRELYREYKHFRGAIPQPVGNHSLDPSTTEFLDLVLARFNGYSDWGLAERTHDEAPWIDAWARKADGGPDYISIDAMRDWFSERAWELTVAAEAPPPPTPDEKQAIKDQFARRGQ